MQTLKEEAIHAIATLPNSATLDDIVYRVYVIEQVLKGIEAANRGEGISSEDLEKEIETW